MIKIGEEVQYNGEWYEVLDIAYLNGTIPTTGVYGRLHIKINLALSKDTMDYVWVLASEVKTYDDMPDESIDLNEVPAHSASSLGRKMTSWLDSLEVRPDNSKMYEIVTLLTAIQYDKEGSYGSSWKGKGEYRGIVANIDRKYDRLDKITDDEIKGKRKPLPTSEYDELTGYDMTNIGESKIDAVADLAVYSLLYMTYLKENYPGAFRVWVAKNVPQYLRDRISFISE